jgi:hypothetical protein
MAETKRNQTRQPPVHIPLPFETAVEGLLKVDPQQPVESVRKKSAKRKASKK